MSLWTHVAAVFRVDCFRGLVPDPDFDKLFGKECLGEDGIEIWDDATKNPENYLPRGSEGSLERSIWVCPDPSYAAAYTVSIFGDLRDYGDVNAIVNWFNNCCRKANNARGCNIRQACITVECENGNNAFLRYEEDG